MEHDEEIITLFKTIIWIAEIRLKLGKFRNINSAISSVMDDLRQFICHYMAEHRGNNV